MSSRFGWRVGRVDRGHHDRRQLNEFGEPIYYTADQTFRSMACRNNPGYREFIRKVVRAGIEDVKLDAIHFDQMQWWPEPNSCQCSYCQTQFREFLATRYPDPQRAQYSARSMRQALP